MVLAAGGYPGAYETGQRIEGLEERVDRTVVFQAGTRQDAHGDIVTAGGRVLTVVGTGVDLAEARERAYDRVETISFEGMHFRSDIATREITANETPERRGAVRVTPE
ncbi:MAG: phosphoribosylglycinamide synthetase C domain-containing protein [Thermomicrobiales bacterium]